MLALEVLLGESDSDVTFIFDEVDSGIGGKTAVEVGARLARLLSIIKSLSSPTLRRLLLMRITIFN